MKVKTSELTDISLDWAVTLIEKPKACEYGVDDWREQRRRTVKNGEYVYRWHQSWMQAGPIIEQEEISISRDFSSGRVEWAAWTPAPIRDDAEAFGYGETPLVAAMRCYVASKLGDEVDVPDELGESK